MKSPAAPLASQELEAELRKEEEKRKARELEEKLIEQEIDEAANIAGGSPEGKLKGGGGTSHSFGLGGDLPPGFKKWI